MSNPVRVIPLERVRMRDLAQVGGKNASLGEMIGELAEADRLAGMLYKLTTWTP